MLAHVRDLVANTLRTRTNGMQNTERIPLTEIANANGVGTKMASLLLRALLRWCVKDVAEPPVIEACVSITTTPLAIFADGCAINAIWAWAYWAIRSMQLIERGHI